MPNRNIRITDIAKLAGVSAGTVDRVLHNRGHVSEDKRKKIEKVLKEINYEPNMIARALASKKNYSLAAIIPSFLEGDYWELVSEGMEKAMSELRKFNVNLTYFKFNQYDRNSFIEKYNELLTQEFDGVLIAALFGEYAAELSIELDAKETPYIYIDSNIENQNNLAYFGGNSFVSGRIAAKLLIDQIGNNTDIIFAHVKFKHNEVSVQMQTREAGFHNYLKQVAFGGKIHNIELNPDDSSQNIIALEKILSQTKEAMGGVVFNSRIYEFIALLAKINPQLKTKIKLVGYEAIESNIKCINNDDIMYLVSQRPGLQGYDAVKALGDNLLFKQIPEKIIYMPLDILIKDNVGYYTN